MVLKPIDWSVLGGITAAIGASLCCAGPLVLVSLGISGAWIANFSNLAVLRPYFIVIVIASFSWAAWLLFRPQTQCASNDKCAKPTIRYRRRILFFTSLALASLIVSSPYWLIALV